MIHLHKYTNWRTERKDILELSNGTLLPYLVQLRWCEKCNKQNIRIDYQGDIALNSVDN